MEPECTAPRALHARNLVAPRGKQKVCILCSPYVVPSVAVASRTYSPYSCAFRFLVSRSSSSVSQEGTTHSTFRLLLSNYGPDFLTCTDSALSWAECVMAALEGTALCACSCNFNIRHCAGTTQRRNLDLQSSLFSIYQFRK